MATSEQNAWITRALGVQFGGVQFGDTSAFDPQALWREAKEAIDGRLGQLADRLRRSGDPDLERIADFGLFGISSGKGINVALNKAMFAYNAAGADKRPQAAQQLRKAVQDYRSTLAGSEGVKLIDNNPFGVPVALVATLGAALERIERSLP